MKVSQVRKIIKVTIELEGEKELGCLDYLLFCDVQPYGSSIRTRVLEHDGLSYDADIRPFQSKLRELLRENDC